VAIKEANDKSMKVRSRQGAVGINKFQVHIIKNSVMIVARSFARRKKKKENGNN